jgi:hypothetical protein
MVVKSMSGANRNFDIFLKSCLNLDSHIVCRKWKATVTPVHKYGKFNTRGASLVE